MKESGRERKRDAAVRAPEGLDAEMAAFVAALRAAPQAQASAGFTGDVMAAVRAAEARPLPGGLFWRGLSRLAAVLPIAAGLALVCALVSALLRPAAAGGAARLVAYQRPDGTFTASSAAPYVQAFAVTVLARDPSAAPRALDAAVEALVREQNAEGGWANPLLSARNVAALGQAAAAGSACARRAHRKGLRYLRRAGIRALSGKDLAREAHALAARLGASADGGLACSVALCAVY